MFSKWQDKPKKIFTKLNSLLSRKRIPFCLPVKPVNIKINYWGACKKQVQYAKQANNVTCNHIYSLTLFTTMGSGDAYCLGMYYNCFGIRMIHTCIYLFAHKVPVSLCVVMVKMQFIKFLGKRQRVSLKLK